MKFEILDMKTVARRMGCSKGHVSKLINGKVKDTPTLPCIRLGRKRAVSEETLNKWLRDRESTGVRK